MPPSNAVLTEKPTTPLRPLQVIGQPLKFFKKYKPIALNSHEVDVDSFELKEFVSIVDKRTSELSSSTSHHEETDECERRRAD